jgi:hypothetical protein
VVQISHVTPLDRLLARRDEQTGDDAARRPLLAASVREAPSPGPGRPSVRPIPSLQTVAFPGRGLVWSAAYRTWPAGHRPSRRQHRSVATGAFRNWIEVVASTPLGDDETRGTYGGWCGVVR